MDPVDVLTRLGGVATWRQLRQVVHWRRIGAALDAGTIVRTATGRYVLPTADEARRAASRLTAVVSHTSAAAHWCWPVKATPPLPHLTIRYKRRINSELSAVLHYRDLEPAEVVDGWVTSRARTVVDCCLDLPFDEALAVVDSALRTGLRHREIRATTASLPDRGRRRVLAVLTAGDARAANPFESVLRSIATSVPGLAAQPRYRIRLTSGGRIRVDLGDEDLRIVLEADSFEFHAARKGFDRDYRRYDWLVLDDWLVLRFTWEMVMFEPGLVTSMIRDAVSLQKAQAQRRGRRTGTSLVRPAVLV